MNEQEWLGADNQLGLDIWKNKYPQISGKSDILGTLYNIGEYGKNGVNSNPQSNDFGKTVKKNYGKMQGLLGLK